MGWLVMQIAQLDLAIESSKQNCDNFEIGPSNIVSSILSFHCLFIHERIGRDSHHSFLQVNYESNKYKVKNLYICYNQSLRKYTHSCMISVHMFSLLNCHIMFFICPIYSEKYCK